MPRGGPRPQRTETKPKPVSGPGRLSQRTDMIPAGGAYGDRKEMQDIIAQGNRATPAPSTASPKIPHIFSPSEFPNEPTTAGQPLGDGPGPEALNLPTMAYNPVQTIGRLAQSDPSGRIQMILQDMQSRGMV